MIYVGQPAPVTLEEDPAAGLLRQRPERHLRRDPARPRARVAQAETDRVHRRLRSLHRIQQVVVGDDARRILPVGKDDDAAQRSGVNRGEQVGGELDQWFAPMAQYPEFPGANCGWDFYLYPAGQFLASDGLLLEAPLRVELPNGCSGSAAVPAADVAVEFEAKRFVLVSTDKAVKPKNVLGHTKAVCEWIIQAAAAREENGTDFISVRFGNVLGSSGSVIPLFRRQIARGGPVTVTHPEMTRYFMTIPEAVQLVIQAGAIGESGDVYVLDMGPPVKIIDLARDMIRLSGKEPDRDIAIEVVGVRPGEKLHEELWADGENAAPTQHPKILRCATQPVDPLWLELELAELERLVGAGETIEVVSRLGMMVRAPRRRAAPSAPTAPAAEPV